MGGSGSGFASGLVSGLSAGVMSGGGASDHPDSDAAALAPAPARDCAVPHQGQ
jgi:hypothetical protein